MEPGVFTRACKTDLSCSKNSELKKTFHLPKFSHIRSLMRFPIWLLHSKSFFFKFSCMPRDVHAHHHVCLFLPLNQRVCLTLWINLLQRTLPCWHIFLISRYFVHHNLRKLRHYFQDNPLSEFWEKLGSSVQDPVCRASCLDSTLWLGHTQQEISLLQLGNPQWRPNPSPAKMKPSMFVM